MGRMLGTPTFLAAACFVLVATMAYPTTQTHLLYSQPGCQAAHCSAASGPGGGVTLKTSARPGVGGKHRPANGGARAHRNEGVPSSSDGGGSPTHHPAGTHHAKAPSQTPTPPVSVGGGQRGPRVSLLFQTLKKWHGGFMAAITIANHGKSALDGWQLWLRYRITQVDRVWGARWFPGSVRSAGLAAASIGQPRIKPGASERFTFRASGATGAPIGCSFDGYHCTFKSVAGGGDQSSPGHHHKTGGGQHGPQPGGTRTPGTKP
jgi:hypothetical protein